MSYENEPTPTSTDDDIEFLDPTEFDSKELDDWLTLTQLDSLCCTALQPKIIEGKKRHLNIESYVMQQFNGLKTEEDFRAAFAHYNIEPNAFVRAGSFHCIALAPDKEPFALFAIIIRMTLQNPSASHNEAAAALFEWRNAFDEMKTAKIDKMIDDIDEDERTSSCFQMTLRIISLYLQLLFQVILFCVLSPLAFMAQRPLLVAALIVVCLVGIFSL